MSRLEELLRSVGAELDRSGYGWALIGGLAVSVRSEPRFTRDVDLVVAVEDDKQAEALVLALQGRGLDLLATLEQETAKRLATARFSLSGDESGVVVDLLFASSGIEREIVQESEVIEIVPGLSAPVAQAGHLIALKILSRDDTNRPQDLADLRALLAAATDRDMTLARSGLQQVTERGYDRGRTLDRELARLTRSA
jgi:hypothetical protein